MRVALMTGAVGWRGSGASFAKVAGGLNRRGHTALLITAAPRLTASFQAEGLPVTQLPARNTGPREIWALHRTLRRLRAEVIMVDTRRDLRLAAYAAWLQGAKVVYRYNHNSRRARGDLGDRLYARRVALLVFQSRFIRDDALRQLPWLAAKPAVQIPNGYDTRRFAPDVAAGRAFRGSYGIADDAFVVMTPGKLARGKGHEVSFAALAELVRQGRRPTQVVLGDGIRDVELRELAHRLGLPTVFTGFLTPEQVAAALNAADLVAHPSPLEIFPNAVGEAMACGRAVVAVDGGGTRELVGSGTGAGGAGVLVPPGSASDMARVLAELWDDPARRSALGEAARRRIKDEFPLRRMIDRYEAAFAELTQRRSRARAPTG